MVMIPIQYNPPSPHWIMCLGKEHQQPGGGGQAIELPLQGPPPLTLPHTAPQREVCSWCPAQND
jgi:hypothetical protein